MKKCFKKLIIIVAIVGSGILSSNAQELGVRFGDVSPGNVAVDAVFSFERFNRIHADVSFGNGGLGAYALWNFVYRQLGQEELNWYLGVGPYLEINDPFWLGAAFEAGLEYKFDSVPIAVGVDWRPSLSIIERTDFHSSGFGLNIRYVFGH